MSDLSLQTLVVISLHVSALMYSPTLLASFVKIDLSQLVCCMLFHDSSISAMPSAMSSAKSKSHKYAQSDTNSVSGTHCFPHSLD